MCYFLCVHARATHSEVALTVPLLSDDDDCVQPRVCDVPFRQQLKSPEFIYIFSFSMVHMVGLSIRLFEHTCVMHE